MQIWDSFFFYNWGRFSLEYARLLREAELLVCNSVISFAGIYLTRGLLLLNIFLMACCQKCQNTQKVAPSFDTLCTVACLLNQSEASSTSLTHVQGSSALMWRKCKLLLPEWAPSAPHLTLRVISQPRAQNANWLRFLQPLYWAPWGHPRPKLPNAADPWCLALESWGWELRHESLVQVWAVMSPVSAAWADWVSLLLPWGCQCLTRVPPVKLCQHPKVLPGSRWSALLALKCFLAGWGNSMCWDCADKGQKRHYTWMRGPSLLQALQLGNWLNPQLVLALEAELCQGWGLMAAPGTVRWLFGGPVCKEHLAPTSASAENGLDQRFCWVFTAHFMHSSSGLPCNDCK